MNILKSDSTFLANSNLMDYSLLLGEIESTEEELKELKEWCQSEDEKDRPHGIYINSDGTKAYVLAIIDCLTDYNCKKKAEYAFKCVTSCSKKMSCVPPSDYATRFFNFLS